MVNPSDNQGVRHLLLNALLNTDRLDDARQLISRYPHDIMADWNYERAYLAWMDLGDSAESRFEMRRAYLGNPFVPGFLMGKRKFHRGTPRNVAIGDENEAIVYASMAKSCWTRQSELREWMAEVTSEFVGFVRAANNIWR